MTNDTNDWAIVFYPETNTWWQRLCPGEFKHVALMRYFVDTDTWMYLDLDFGGVHCFIRPATEEGMLPIAQTVGKCAILKFKVKDRKLAFRGMFTCVQFVKHALGFNKPWVLFPDQLYWSLLKNGAEHLKS
jgi:hypothetical protein